jgi:ribosomal protein S18 acetylase RimI-like enzyme
VIHYRKFRNTDPPALVEIWNEVVAGRGGVKLLHSTPLESCVFSKPYFDPAGLLIAEDDGRAIGFAHAGFGSDARGTALNYKMGVVCMFAVRPASRRKGVGTRLLQECERYLQEKGARAVLAGAHPPLDPYYLGLYGGAGLPGILTYSTEAEPFLLKHRYQHNRSIAVMQRRLIEPFKMADPRYAAFLQQLESRVCVRRASGPWWREATLGALEPLEILLEDRGSRELLARALAWELEGFGDTCPSPAVAIMDIVVKESRRRQGLGKFFLSQFLRTLQEQYFETAQIQVEDDNAAGIAFCLALGFKKVCEGRVYKKSLA